MNFHQMTSEDWAIWSRFHRRHRMDCQRADADAFSWMSDYADSEPHVLKSAVRMEAYAADMYGTPDYSDVEGA